MSNGFNTTFNGKAFKIDSCSGKVLDTTTRAETEVSGSGGGGGGFTYNGTGGSGAAPVRITPTTTHFTKIFLLEPDGKEHAIELVDFDVRCRAGNGLSLVWAINLAKNEGPYIAAYNHNTREMEFNLPILAKLNTPKLYSLAGGAAAGFLLGLLLHFGGFAIITALIGLGIGDMIGKRIGKARAKTFVSSPEMQKLRGAFERIPASELAVLTPA
ncbi:hypothetical protein BH11PSE2_BH11PSE2_21810 [soil metagenome]